MGFNSGFKGLIKYVVGNTETLRDNRVPSLGDYQK